MPDLTEEEISLIIDCLRIYADEVEKDAANHGGIANDLRSALKARLLADRISMQTTVPGDY